MKKIICAFVMLSAAAYSKEKQCGVPADDRAIRQVAEEWKNGYNSGDSAKVAALYAEDGYYLTQHFVTGIVHGRDAMKAYVQRGIGAKYQVDSIEIIATGCSGDLAYTVGRYQSTNAGQKASGVNVVVLKRTRRTWLIVAHEAAVPDPETAIRSLDTPAKR